MKNVLKLDFLYASLVASGVVLALWVGAKGFLTWHPFVMLVLSLFAGEMYGDIRRRLKSLGEQPNKP